MALTEKSQNHILQTYAAHWFGLTKATGLDGWMTWFLQNDTDDYCANEAMRRIVEERIQQGRFGSKDILKLTEMQAVYYKVKAERNNASRSAEMEKDDCSYCSNHGFRWMVYHSKGYMAEENLIRSVPSDDIRMYVGKYTVPCTCQRGFDLYNRRVNEMKKEARITRPIEMSRLYKLLEKWSMDHESAWRLVVEYTKIRNAIYFPKTQEELREERRKAQKIQTEMRETVAVVDEDDMAAVPF